MSVWPDSMTNKASRNIDVYHGLNVFQKLNFTAKVLTGWGEVTRSPGLCLPGTNTVMVGNELVIMRIDLDVRMGSASFHTPGFSHLLALFPHPIGCYSVKTLIGCGSLELGLPSF